MSGSEHAFKINFALGKTCLLGCHLTSSTGPFEHTSTIEQNTTVQKDLVKNEAISITCHRSILFFTQIQTIHTNKLLIKIE